MNDEHHITIYYDKKLAEEKKADWEEREALMEQSSKEDRGGYELEELMQKLTEVVGEGFEEESVDGGLAWIRSATVLESILISQWILLRDDRGDYTAQIFIESCLLAQSKRYKRIDTAINNMPGLIPIAIKKLTKEAGKALG